MPNFSRNRSKSPSASLFDASAYACNSRALVTSAGSVGGASGDASHSAGSPFSEGRSLFYPFIRLIDEIPYVIRIISYLVDLRLILWCPVGQYLLFTLVFECPIPNALDDFSELFSALLRWHEMRSTDKYINIAIHTLI